ncbi:hypothetical protein [Roseovarius salis]|uniref:hypothetical protein n=1 Tax=Roseovarius salis TaxID=3376063 RepID=UPI0037C9C02A
MKEKGSPRSGKSTYINVPEAVGVFDSAADLRAAFHDLRLLGFRLDDISLLARQEVLEEKLGDAFWKATELEDNPDAPRANFVSEEAIGELEGAIAGGFLFLGSYVAMAALLTPASTLAASIAAIAVGGGPAGVIGSLLARRVGQRHREYYENQIKHGGILMWVRVADKEKEDLAVKILKGHSGRDVHVHPWSE